MPHLDEARTILRYRATDSFGMGSSYERLMQSATSRKPGILEDCLSSPPVRAKDACLPNTILKKCVRDVVDTADQFLYLFSRWFSLFVVNA